MSRVATAPRLVRLRASRRRERRAPGAAREPRRTFSRAHVFRARDGTELFYWRESTLLVARVEAGAEFRVLGRTVLFTSAYARWSFHAEYDIDPEGRRFVMVKRSSETSHRIVVVLNWFDELRRQVGESP